MILQKKQPGSFSGMGILPVFFAHTGETPMPLSLFSSMFLDYLPSAAAASRYLYRAETMLKRIATTKVKPA